MLDWIQHHDALLWWLAAGSAVMFFGSLIAMPILVARIPADYFARDVRPTSRWSNYHPMLRVVLRVLKNLLGVVLVLAGLAMLVMPGQGLLTMLVGLLLLEVPGKFRFEKWLISRPRIIRSINWLRVKAGRGPLEEGEPVAHEDD